MSKIISASIDLNKIDKSRIKEHKNGAKYYNLTIICNDTQDTYGNDVSIQQGQTPEERAAKAKKVFIGNGKTVYDNHATAPTAGKNNNDNDSLPF